MESKGFWAGFKNFREAIKQSIHTVIDALSSPFFDRDQFSWKKGITAATTFVFTYACIGFLNKNDFKVLPKPYLYVIAGIFAMYFLKDIPTNVLNVAASYFATRGGKSIRSVEDVINSPAEVSADQPQSGKGDQP